MKLAKAVLALAAMFPATTMAATTMAAQTMCSITQTDVYLVVDESGSVGSGNFNTMKSFIKDVLIDNTMMNNPIIPNGSGIGIGGLTYSSSVMQAFDPTTDHADAQMNIMNWQFNGGSTYTYDALVHASNALRNAPSGPNKRKMIILFTDGKPTSPVCDNGNVRSGLVLTDIELVTVEIGTFDSSPLSCLPGSTIAANFADFTMNSAFSDLLMSEVCECMDASGCGDPHFKTWDGKWYDFHGICDLQMLKNEGFANGLGLDIHIRTKPRYGYSYIESAAIKIGDDILEIGSYGQYYFNGVQNSDLTTMAGFPVSFVQKNEKESRFEISLLEQFNEKIVVNTFKDLIAVNVENATLYNFKSSQGLMGQWGTGAHMARDGVTIIEDNDKFGQEWQVLPGTPTLFQAESGRQILGSCDPPTDSKQRRLGETMSTEAAEKACTHFEGQKFDMCVFDVIAMNDLEVADHHGAF